ncbi:hypothetical protein [Pseudonocardia adelaidensis]
MTITNEGLGLVRETMSEARLAEEIVFARLTPSEQAQPKGLLRRLIGIEDEADGTRDE